VPHEEADAPGQQPKAVDDLEANVALAAQISEEVVNMPIQVRFLRSIRLFVAVAIAVALLAVLAASSALAAETKSLYLVKTCTFTPTVTCLVTTSTLKILRGSTFHYLGPASLGTTGSPMLITTANRVRKGTASGVCHFSGTTGHCVFTSGTGSLAGFHADLNVLSIGGADFSLTGTYWFDRHHDDNNDRD
jgi:hypothetical protein